MYVKNNVNLFFEMKLNNEIALDILKFFSTLNQCIFFLRKTLTLFHLHLPTVQFNSR